MSPLSLALETSLLLSSPAAFVHLSYAIDAVNECMQAPDGDKNLEEESMYWRLILAFCSSPFFPPFVKRSVFLLDATSKGSVSGISDP